MKSSFKAHRVFGPSSFTLALFALLLGPGIYASRTLNDNSLGTRRLAGTYAPGWCGVHITQYQKNEGPGANTADYRFDVFLYDANGQLIGESRLLDIPSGSTESVDSRLPYTFDVTAGNVDADPVLMAYADQHWGSNDQAHQCSFGGYDSGNRDGDCGFTC